MAGWPPSPCKARATGRANIHVDFTSPSGECCEPVMDTYAWLAFMAFIPTATWFLRGAVTKNINGRKKRSLPGHPSEGMCLPPINFGSLLVVLTRWPKLITRTTIKT